MEPEGSAHGEGTLKLPVYLLLQGDCDPGLLPPSSRCFYGDGQLSPGEKGQVGGSGRGRGGGGPASPAHPCGSPRSSEMHTGPTGFLRAPLLPRTFQASLVSGPLYILILCLQGPSYTTPFTFTHPLSPPPPPPPPPPSVLSLQAASTRKSSLMLLGDSSSAPHVLSAPPRGSTSPTDCAHLAGGAGPALLSPVATVTRQCVWNECEPCRQAGWVG